MKDQAKIEKAMQPRMTASGTLNGRFPLLIPLSEYWPLREMKIEGLPRENEIAGEIDGNELVLQTGSAKRFVSDSNNDYSAKNHSASEAFQQLPKPALLICL